MIFYFSKIIIISELIDLTFIHDIAKISLSEVNMWLTNSLYFMILSLNFILNLKCSSSKIHLSWRFVSFTIWRISTIPTTTKWKFTLYCCTPPPPLAKYLLYIQHLWNNNFYSTTVLWVLMNGGDKKLLGLHIFVCL